MSQAEEGLTATRTESEILLRSKSIAAVELGRARQNRKDHIALLVPDENLQATRSALQGLARAQVHLFSPSGADGASFRLDHPDYRGLTLAVFPIIRAREILARSLSDPGLDHDDRFRVAAYVRAYFGSVARLMGLKNGAEECDDLGRLAGISGLAPVDMSSRGALDMLLSDWDWRPSDDMLERLSLADPWIRDNLIAHASDRGQVSPGLSVFFCRARAVEQRFLDQMRKAIESTGFEILRSVPLQGQVAERIEHATRGGNWGAGPFPVSGGPPVHVFVAVDVFAQSPAAATLKKHPFLDNQRTLTAKMAARSAIFGHIPESDRFNPMHSTDTSIEAMRVIRQLLTDAEVDEVLAQFNTRLQEVDDLGHGADYLPGDGSVSLLTRIVTPAGPCLRKIFRRQYAEHLPAIAEMQDRLAREMPEYPPVLEKGASFLDLADPGASYLPLSSSPRLLPVKTILRLRSLLEQAAGQGADLSAFDPRHDMLISPDGNHIRIPPFDLPGCANPSRSLSDLVPGKSAITAAGPTYDDAWYPALRVPRQVFLSGHAPSFRFRSRLIYPAFKAIRRVRALIRRILAVGWRRLKRFKSILLAR